MNKKTGEKVEIIPNILVRYEVLSLEKEDRFPGIEFKGAYSDGSGTKEGVSNN